MSRKALTLVVAAVGMVPALGMVLQKPWATQLWPYDTGRLTYIFLGSMIAAIIAAGAYVWAIRDLGAIPGGALNLVVMFGGFALFVGHQAWTAWAWLVAHNPNQIVPDVPQMTLDHLAPYAWLFAGIAVVSLVILIWARRLPFVDPSPIPRAVTYSFMLFIAVLVGAGVALILRVPNIMPWPVDPNTSVMIGIIFVADATYFIYGLARPAWSNARGQLVAFLAYDLILIVPLLAHFKTVPSGLLLNLVVYVAVVVYSGALATYYLFVWPGSAGAG